MKRLHSALIASLLLFAGFISFFLEFWLLIFSSQLLDYLLVSLVFVLVGLSWLAFLAWQSAEHEYQRLQTLCSLLYPDTEWRKIEGAWECRTEELPSVHNLI